MTKDARLSDELTYSLGNGLRFISFFRTWDQPIMKDVHLRTIRVFMRYTQSYENVFSFEKGST